jgi:hypothetical protein
VPRPQDEGTLSRRSGSAPGQGSPATRFGRGRGGPLRKLGAAEAARSWSPRCGRHELARPRRGRSALQAVAGGRSRCGRAPPLAAADSRTRGDRAPRGHRNEKRHIQGPQSGFRPAEEAEPGVEVQVGPCCRVERAPDEATVNGMVEARPVDGSKLRPRLTSLRPKPLNQLASASTALGGGPPDCGEGGKCEDGERNGEKHAVLRVTSRQR